MLRTTLILLLFAVQFLHGQTIYYPDSTWQTRKPSDLNMNAQLLDSAINFAINHEVNLDYDLRVANLKTFANEPGYRLFGPTKERGKPAGLIIRNGFIAAQWGDIKRVDMTYSVAKSFLSTVAGLAYDNRLIKNVDDRVNEYVWDEKFSGKHNSKITWRHLLTQSSDWSGCLFDFCDWADRPPKEGTIDEWQNRKLLEPGTNYEYNDVRVNLLAYSLLQVWRKSLPVVLKEKIMDPIGASTTWRWYGYDNSFVNIDGTMVQSVSGGGHFGGGMFINSLDMARFGLLFLRQGKWKNHQLISKDWINTALQPSSTYKSYGFLWWINEENRYKDVSKKIFSAEGFGGNIIVMDREHDLVIVARWLDSGSMSDFVKMVINAVEKK